MPNYTQALYEARELAMERMQTEANELQAEGIVGARIVEKSHGWGSHVIEFFAIGTAVVSISADHTSSRPRWSCRCRAERRPWRPARARGDTRPAAGMADTASPCPTSTSSRRSTRTRPKESFDGFHERIRASGPEAHVYEVVAQPPSSTRCSPSARAGSAPRTSPTAR